MKAKDRSELVRMLSKSKILVAADLDLSTLKDMDVDVIVSRCVGPDGSSTAPFVITNEFAKKLLSEVDAEKRPAPIEIVGAADYKPIAADVISDYRINDVEFDRIEGVVNDFVVHFRDRLNRIKEMIKTSSPGGYGLLSNIEGVNKFSDGREVTVVGMVMQKITTKNGNIMVTLEDESGSVKVIFMNGSQSPAKELFEKASTIIDDEVLAVRGKFSHPFIMAKELVWPDIPIRIKKTTEEDIGIAFLSDIHTGSKMFMEKNFSTMISWFNGKFDKYKDLAGKVKYLIIGGDMIDGVNVHPDQERTLAITDMYSQYKVLFDFMEAIPDHIEIFMLPGNHDAMARAEPQLALSSDIRGDLKRDNVHFVTNPCYLTLHGIDILSYHGTSIDSIVRSVPNMSYAKPEKAMIELVKRRHLSPIHGGNVIVPTKHDNMVIDRVPDVVHMGHVHKNGYENYHGVDLINSGTWQSITDLQMRSGHIPTPCYLPILETKEHVFKIVDFNTW